MALHDNAVLVPSTVHFYLAPVGTAKPADVADIDTPWVEIGHTSIEDLMSFESDGGDQTVLGTAQNASLKVTTARRTESFAFNLQQFDSESLKLYFGSNAVVASGWVDVPDAPASTASAFLAVFTEGAKNLAFHAARAEILRGDDLDFADTESLASLPIKVTPTKYGTNTGPYSVYALPTV